MVILNTRGRDCPLHEAVARAQAAARVLERNGIPLIYQKIDSTLRGHWAETLKVLAEVTKPDHVLVCPAFPARGRFVRHGELRLAQRINLDSLCAAEMGTHRRLRTALWERSHWQARVIELKVVRGGRRAIQLALRSGKPAPCAVFDAEREDDLRKISRAFCNSSDRLLWVGSAGLIRHVIPHHDPPECAPRPIQSSPWLLIQGSRQRASRAQFRMLEKRHGVYLINFLPDQDQETLRLWAREAARALAAGINVAIVAPEQFDPRVPAKLPRGVDWVLEALPRKPNLAGIFVTGGNTAEAVCDSLQVRTLRVVEEIRPGIAMSLALDGRRPGLELITKAGGFGGPGEVWEILARYWRGR